MTRSAFLAGDSSPDGTHIAEEGGVLASGGKAAVMSD